MDDFEYSLYISDQDWETFYQECEGCNLLCPGLASREESGMSDVDELGYHCLHLPRPPGAAFTEADPNLQTDRPPVCEGSPVDSYLSKYGVRSPEQVLSGSEEDLHLETVNLFFEQLKSVAVPEQPLEVSCAVNWASEKTDELKELINNQVIQSGVTCPSGRNEVSFTREITKQGEFDACGCTALEEAIVPTQTNASDSTGRESLTLQIVPERTKHKQEKTCCDLSTELKLKPEANPPDTQKMTPVVAVNDSSPAKTQRVTGSSTDSKDSLIRQPVSPSNLRRKRRKKRRMSNESRETGHGCEARVRVHQSESEEERFTLREEMYSSLTTNVRKTESSVHRIKTSSTPCHADHSHTRFTSASDFSCSQSLPVSLTTFISESKPELRHTSIFNHSKSMNDLSPVNNEPLKAQVCQLSLLPQTDKIINSQGNYTGLSVTACDTGLSVTACDTGLSVTACDSGRQLEDTDCSAAQMGAVITETSSDNSAAGCQRKSSLSANVSSAADSTDTLSCLGNEMHCCAFKSEQNVSSTLNTRQFSDTHSSGLSENTEETESCSDGNSLTGFLQDTLTASEHMDCTKSQTLLSTDSPLSERTETECHITDSTVIFDHRKDESHHQNSNTSCEVFILNASQVKPENSAADLDSNGDSSGNQDEMILSEDSTQDVSEFPPPTAAETQEAFSCCHESRSVVKETESLVLDDQIPSTVSAISSFWTEMEKLTINDILRLRMISNGQHPCVLTQPEDGSIVDPTDAADSGYFTQPDECKPERLSGDMSFISDLDEDLAQLQTQCSSKQEDSSSGFPSRSCSVTWEHDSDPSCTGDNMVFFGSERTFPEHLNTANPQQGFRDICKNISLQNQQAIAAQPVRPVLRRASLHTIHSKAEDPFYHISTSFSACSSDDEEVESSGVTFAEIMQYFFGGEEPERCASPADSNAASDFDETGTCVPEMYDHFFSEFASESFFNPFGNESGGNKDKMVPIFSCTRSANRNLQFPDAYDYFFPDSPVHSDEEDESDNVPITVVTRYDHNSPKHCPVSATDMYEHFYPEDTFQGNFLWSNPFSFRRAAHTDPAGAEDESCSWAVTSVKPPHRGIHSLTVMRADDRRFTETLYLSLEKHILQQLSQQQKKCVEMQTLTADPRLDAPFLPLRQADMCLICIAFASWVLKSASPGADAWKAALLANISALSAIRYLRRHKREELPGKPSLLQIESAETSHVQKSSRSSVPSHFLM